MYFLLGRFIAPKGGEFKIKGLSPQRSCSPTSRLGISRCRRQRVNGGDPVPRSRSNGRNETIDRREVHGPNEKWHLGVRGGRGIPPMSMKTALGLAALAPYLSAKHRARTDSSSVPGNTRSPNDNAAC